MKYTTIPDRQLKSGEWRFAVELQEDDGTPQMLIEGWRLRKWRYVIPPTSYGFRQQQYHVVKVLNQEFADRIRDALLRKIDPDQTKRQQADLDEEDE